jgi:hypothetical protein
VSCGARDSAAVTQSRGEAEFLFGNVVYSCDAVGDVTRSWGSTKHKCSHSFLLTRTRTQEARRRIIELDKAKYNPISIAFISTAGR